MDNVIELRPRDAGSRAGAADTSARQTVNALAGSMRRLVGSAEDLVETLEASLARIRLVIDTVVDRETRNRLAGDHVALSAALRDAKAQLASIAADFSPRQG